jgi:hypothetical protein
MSDLIERLRNAQPGERQGKHQPRMELWGLLTEAANEIEALRADKKRLREALDGAARVLHKAEEQFTTYANQHSVEGTAEGDEKAATNKKWALRCFSAYVAAQGGLK